MQHLDYRGIDVTKAALFVLLAVFLVVTLVMTVLIPEVRKLKVAHMAVERSEVIRSQARAEFEMQKSLLKEAQTEHRDLLAILGEPFEPDQFHQQAAKHFSLLEIKNQKAGDEGAFRRTRLDLQAHMSEPASFYDFVLFLRENDRVLELDFPITVQVDDQRRLIWDFAVNDYRRQADR